MEIRCRQLQLEVGKGNYSEVPINNSRQKKQQLTDCSCTVIIHAARKLFFFKSHTQEQHKKQIGR